ncbi:MscL family protein [Catenulispora rubra]|uniref:MscL family protein n=1 Tax=Catenulispora rubra TaxID=280293 RepID=UPI001E516C9B|nr:MscL family protein [Catenulispora rubra]
MNGFVKFVVRGNVVGLAVGVVIGAAFAAMVTSFTGAFLTPLIGWATGGIGDYSKKVFTLGKTTFPYGTFINASISFLLTAATLYFLIVLPVNKLTEELNPHHDLSHAKRACPECLQQIPARARRCSFCTTTVSPILDEDSPALTDEIPGEIPLHTELPEMKLPESAPASSSAAASGAEAKPASGAVAAGA